MQSLRLLCGLKGRRLETVEEQLSDELLFILVAGASVLAALVANPLARWLIRDRRAKRTTLLCDKAEERSTRS